jgi:tetratricopeptide (TPR) repeat protein
LSNSIHNEFLSIKESDSAGLVQFYHKHKSYFTENREVDQDLMKRRLWMLSSIVVAAIKVSESEIVKRKRFSTIRAFEQHAREYNHSLALDPNYNLLILEIASDLYKRKKYLQATRLFKRNIRYGNNTPDVKDLYNTARNRFLLRLGRTSGIIGITILAIKYFTRYSLGISLFDGILLGYLGGLLILIFGLIETMIKLPSR